MVCIMPTSVLAAGVGPGCEGHAVERNAAAKASTPARLRRCVGSGTTPASEASVMGRAQNGHAASLART